MRGRCPPSQGLKLEDLSSQENQEKPSRQLKLQLQFMRVQRLGLPAQCNC